MSYKFCPHCGKAFVEVEEPRTVPAILQKKEFITWEQVKALSVKDEASTLFDVGDEIHETLKNGEEVVFVVVGKDMYRPGDVIFSLKDCLAESQHMNDDATNEGGWNASKMRKYLHETVLPLLPDDLRACIVPRILDGESNTLWLFSEMEIFGVQSWAVRDPDCGKQMPYFMRHGNRVKGLGKDGIAAIWWERSPHASDTTSFCGVNYYGIDNYYIANYYATDSSDGVAFGFCV